MEEFVNQKALNDFNKKWAGKRAMFCYMLFTKVVFWHDKITHCCSCTTNPHANPIICTDELADFSFSRFIANLDKTMKLNQTRNGGPCKGCKYIKFQKVPMLPVENTFREISITNFTICNSRCIYCELWQEKQSFYYPVLPIIRLMNENNLIHPDAHVSWGGGEILLYREFKDIFKYLLKNGFKQVINTTGISYSKEIEEGLKSGIVDLQISPDAGLIETYKKVKGQDAFYKVWENIEKYSVHSENVSVKYIIFSLNSSEEDVRAFINNCVKAKVRQVVISCEWRTIWNYDEDWQYGGLTEKEYNAAALMLRLAEDNNLEVSISAIWSEKDRKYIRNSATKIKSEINV